MFNTPILFIIFNRLDTVKQTFPKIKAQQPAQLFIAADGPRVNKLGEKEKCAEVREWVLSQIDWNCNVKTLFREENLGCKYGVSSAIKWYFSNIEKGIVLEDDILPTDSFFKYCEELLSKYENSPSIGVISGANIQTQTPTKDSYFLSTIPGVWGWASWKRVIEKYDPDCSQYNEIIKQEKKLNTICLSKQAAKSLINNSYDATLGKIDTWDFQFVEHCINQKLYTIYPKKSLVRNIGFIADSTHTVSAPSWYQDKSFELSFPLNIEKLQLNKKYTKMYEQYFIPHSFILKTFVHKGFNFVKKLLIFFTFSKYWHPLYTDLKLTILRNLSGSTGIKLRYKYYKKRLAHLGHNVLIDTGVFITGEQFISIDDNTHIDKNCILVASPENLDLSYRYVKTRTNPNYLGKKGSITIGKNCHISQNAMIYGYGGVSIEDNSVMSCGAKIYSLTSMAYNPDDKSEIVSIVPYDGKSPTLMGAVVLGNNVWIGIDSVVCPGVTLKDHTFAKSQSIINSSFDVNSYIGGSPAKYIRERYMQDKTRQDKTSNL